MGSRFWGTFGVSLHLVSWKLTLGVSGPMANSTTSETFGLLFQLRQSITPLLKGQLAADGLALLVAFETLAFPLALPKAACVASCN